MNLDEVTKRKRNSRPVRRAPHSFVNLLPPPPTHIPTQFNYIHKCQGFRLYLKEIGTTQQAVRVIVIEAKDCISDTGN